MTKLHELLGLSYPPKNGLAWHDIVVAGLPASAYGVLSRHLGVEEAALVTLVQADVPVAEGVPLGRNASNFLYRIAKALREMTVVTAGDTGRAVTWLKSSQPVLRGRHPIDLLQTHIGSEFVFTAISRMKQEQPPVRSEDYVEENHEADDDR